MPWKSAWRPIAHNRPLGRDRSRMGKWPRPLLFAVYAAMLWGGVAVSGGTSGIWIGKEGMASGRSLGVDRPGHSLMIFWECVAKRKEYKGRYFC